MNSIEPGCRQRKLLIRHFTLELGQLPAQMAYELEPFFVVGIRNVDRCESRVLPDARMNFGDAFGDKNDDVVLLQKPRACNPALKRHKVRAIVPRHVADVSGGDDRIEKVDDDGYLIAVEQKVFDQRKRASGVFGKLPKRVAAHQRIGYAKQCRELALRFLRAELNSFASVVGQQLLCTDEFALKIVKQADKLGARADKIVDVVVEKEVTSFAGVVLAGHPSRPRRQLIDFIQQKS